MSSNDNAPRDGFGSKFGALAAAAGSAIGLGNIWKFPYIVGQNGGAALVFVFLIFIVCIGVPVMLAEFLIGRRTQRTAVTAFKTLKPKSPWFLTGLLGVLTAFLILSFYSVVAGWTLHYTYFSLTQNLVGNTPELINQKFGAFVSNPWQPVFWEVVFSMLTAGIVWGGVQNGIEKYSKILMPLLFVILLMLVVRSVTLPGASKGIEFFLKPDFSKLTKEGVLIALGHAFFSLSLGMGTMIAYGSYIRKDQSLLSMTLQVSLADTAVAILAGLAIFPAVFAFGLSPSEGVGLVFKVLPNVFNQMPGGAFFSVAFFMLLAVAALTSTISVLEVIVMYMVEELNVSRHVAVLLGFVSTTLLGALCSLSMSPDSVVSTWTFPILKSASEGFSQVGLFDFFEWWASNVFLPLGGLLIAFFVGWRMLKSDIVDELSSNGLHTLPWYNAFIFALRVLAPIAIVVIFMSQLGVFK